jgi:hypothetical protein
METIKVTCTDTDKTLDAEILRKGDKSIRVFIKAANITLTLSRTDVRKPYVGNCAGMEFTAR